MEMQKIYFLLLMVLLIFNKNSFAFNWKVNVIYPDNEIKMYQIDDRNKKIILPGSEWNCEITKLKKENNAESKSESRNISCFIHNGNNGFSIALVCAKLKNDHGPVFEGQVAHLYGKKYFRIAVKCED
jgi:hypothetical protein